MSVFGIHIQNVSLKYDLHFDKTNNFKEAAINFLMRRRPTEQKKSVLLAVDNLDLQIKEGDRLGIVGLNGAGKSTVLKLISGILKPTAGDLDVCGHVQPLIEIGAGFDPEFSGRENIYLNGYMLGFNKRQLKEKEREIIEFSELGEFIDTPVKYYSSGMSVRLAFTIATMIEPEILVIDEMLGAGDAAFIHKARRRMDELIGKAKIIVIVSHDLSLISGLCNRILVMDHGKKAFEGSTQEGLEAYNRIVRARVNAEGPPQ